MPENPTNQRKMLKFVKNGIWSLIKLDSIGPIYNSSNPNFES